MNIKESIKAKAIAFALAKREKREKNNVAA
jgi:hypothetical protein